MAQSDQGTERVRQQSKGFGVNTCKHKQGANINNRWSLSRIKYRQCVRRVNLSLIWFFGSSYRTRIAGSAAKTRTA
jgi:hypothetical protein